MLHIQFSFLASSVGLRRREDVWVFWQLLQVVVLDDDDDDNYNDIWLVHVSHPCCRGLN